MIKLPEPVELNPAANSVMGHSDATLKQAIRDVLEEAAKVCVDAIKKHDCHSNYVCANEIRALIKEI